MPVLPEFTPDNVLGWVRECVAEHLKVPEVVAYGSIDNREWLISRRVSGHSLLDAWPGMSSIERRESIVKLGSGLRALHQLDVPAGYENPWISHAVNHRIAPDHPDYPLPKLERLLAGEGH